MNIVLAERMIIAIVGMIGGLRLIDLAVDLQVRGKSYVVGQFLGWIGMIVFMLGPILVYLSGFRWSWGWWL